MDKPSEPSGAESCTLREASVHETEGTEGKPAASRLAFPALPVPKNEASLSSEEQECRICYNLFDLGRRVPKLLECLHTFCQDCLSRLHLHSSPSSPGGDSPGGGGGQAYVTCPLCRHCTALPDGCVQSLPVNTKLIAGILQEAPGGDFGLQQQRLLLQVPRPAACQQRSPSSSRSRSPSQQSAGATATQTSSASVTITSLEVCSESDGACSCIRSCQRKAGCVCVFALLATLLVGFAWMEWITGFIFLGVTLIVLASVMPYVYKLKSVSESRAVPLTVTASGGPGEGAGSCSSDRPGGRDTPGSRRSRC